MLADALQELGDPRGEFISLQLHPRRSQRSERRMQKLLERHRGAFLGRLQPVVMPRLRTLELTGSFRGVPLEAVVAQLRRGGELLPANVEFNAIGVRMRIKRADGFCSLVVEVEPFSGVYWLETVLWPVTADAFDEVLITSAQPLETVSLAVSTHSRMK